MVHLSSYQPFAAVLRNDVKEETPLDILFKNLLKSDFQFKNLESNFNTGYPVDIYFQNLDSEDSTLNFEFAIPGAEMSDVEITKTKDGELRVKHSKQHAVDGRDYFSRTISKRSFDLMWKIPKRFDLDRLSAKFKNGLLIISIPRSSDSLPEKVEISE